MNLKNDSNLKEPKPGKIKRHEEKTTGLIGSLNDPFHGVTQNMAAGAEILGNVINGLLSARKYATERVEQFIKKKLLFREVSFYAVL